MQEMIRFRAASVSISAAPPQGLFGLRRPDCTQHDSEKALSRRLDPRVEAGFPKSSCSTKRQGRDDYLKNVIPSLGDGANDAPYFFEDLPDLRLADDQGRGDRQRIAGDPDDQVLVVEGPFHG